MKTIIIAFIIMLAGTTGFAQVKKSMGHHPHHNTETKRYSCTLHPEVVRNRPGRCPKCGRKLIEGQNFR